MKKMPAIWLSLPILVPVFMVGDFTKCAYSQVYQVDVYVGYLNNLSGQPSAENTPRPFANLTGPSPNKLLAPDQIASLDAPHDTGVIMFMNSGGRFVDINLDSICVIVLQNGNQVCLAPPINGTTGPTWSQINGGSSFRLEPGSSLVLAETGNTLTGQTQDFDFDTSNVIPITPTTRNPHVTGTIETDLSGNASFDFEDTQRVLFGNEEAVNTAESHYYVKIGRIGREQLPPPPGPLALQVGGTCSPAYLASASFDVGNFGDTDQAVEATGPNFTVLLDPPNDSQQGEPSPLSGPFPTVIPAGGHALFNMDLVDNSILMANQPSATVARLTLNLVNPNQHEPPLELIQSCAPTGP
ncbi:MAG: hypothetical protein JO007_18985 [Alphaproteobacteria bacterium]|nr:hypothetical protein [Alphaproteobacteria bacterium]